MHYNLFLVLATLIYSSSASGVVQPWNEADDYSTSTIAGKYVSGFSDGDLTNATFNRPMALAIDHRTQELYVVDHGNHAIRRVRVARSVLIGQTQPDAGEGGNASDTSMPDAIGAQDYVTTLAGGARGYRDGVGTAARFSEPSGCAIDPYTRLLFVADTGNNVIREIDLDTAMVTTLAGAPQTSGFINGRGQAAAFRHPTGVALAIRSRQLFVCDAYNHAIRVIHTVTREVRTLAGTGFQGSFDGAGHVATFHLPFAAAVDEDEELVYVAEMSPRIRVLRTALEPTYPQPAIPSTATIDPAFTIDVSTKLDGEGQLGIEEVAGLATAYGWPGGALMFTDAADDTIYRLSLDEWYPPPIAPSPPLVAPPPGGINGSDALNVVVTDDIGGGTGGGTGTGGTGTGGATAGNSTDTVASAPLAGRMLSDDHWRMLSESTPLPPASPPNASEMTPQMPPLPPPPPPDLTPRAPPEPPSIPPWATPLTPPSVPPSPPPPRESCEAIPPGENCEVCGQGVPPTEGMECHHYLWRMAGNTPGQRDGRGTRSRFYRPSGLAIDDRTRTVYIADTYNHRIRLIDLMDVPDVIVEDIEYWYEWIGRLLRQNLIFIILLSSSCCCGCCCCWLCCRYCSLCPLYQRRLHKQRIKQMQLGGRV